MCSLWRTSIKQHIDFIVEVSLQCGWLAWVYFANCQTFKKLYHKMPTLIKKKVMKYADTAKMPQNAETKNQQQKMPIWMKCRAMPLKKC